MGYYTQLRSGTGLVLGQKEGEQKDTILKQKEIKA